MKQNKKTYDRAQAARLGKGGRHLKGVEGGCNVAVGTAEEWGNENVGVNELAGRGSGAGWHQYHAKNRRNVQIEPGKGNAGGQPLAGAGSGGV